MPTNSLLFSDVFNSLSTPVKLTRIKARILAYVETKTEIITFRLVGRNTSLIAYHNLPEEIMSTCSIRSQFSLNENTHLDVIAEVVYDEH